MTKNKTTESTARDPKTMATRFVAKLSADNEKLNRMADRAEKSGDKKTARTIRAAAASISKGAEKLNSI